MAQTCGATMLCALASGALAQQSTIVGGNNPPEVFVNMELLNSLGPGPLPAYSGYGNAPGQGGQLYMNRPGTLLYPPALAPRSQLTVPAPALAPGEEYESVLLTERIQLTPPAGMPSAKPAAPAQPAMAAEPPPAPKVAKAEPKPAAPAKPAEPVAQAAAATPEVPKIPAPDLTAQAAAAAQMAPAAGSDSVPTPPAPEPAMAETPAVPEPATIAGTESATTTADMMASSAPETPPAPALPPEPSETASTESAPAAPQETAPAPTQQAALTTGLEEGQVRLLFGDGSADLSEDAKTTLRELAKELEQDSNLRIQLLAYAATTEDSASRARRLSLSRALAVRAYLIDQGVRSTRMDVRALGNKIEDGPADRVDIVPARR